MAMLAVSPPRSRPRCGDETRARATNPMPEVLILCEYATLHGGERSMLAGLDRLRAAGFVPAVLAPTRGPLIDELARRGVETLPFECRAGDGVRRPLHRLREELADRLRCRRPALLHANSLAMARLSGPVAAELNLPSLGHLRDIVKLSRQAVADLNCHQRLLAVSDAVRAFHIATGLAAEKVFTLTNGVDLDVFCPRPATGYLHRELGLPAESPLLGAIGQISLRKGQDVLLRAAAGIIAQWPNARILIVGQRHSEKDESRRLERDLHEAASRLPAGCIHFLGDRNDVQHLLNELTLLVHPARQEPLGRVLLEAAASGTAVVAADVGGTPEIFPPDRNAARLVPPGDAAALAAAVVELLGEPSLRNRMAAAARRRAEEQFDVRRYVEGLLGHYRAIS